jgi:hypothetical protein
MRARRGIAERRTGDERHVGEVRAARVRIVEHVDVFRPRPARANGRDGIGEGAEVDGDVLGLDNHPPARVEERGRAVAALLDVRAER